jgi:hypothetical protein
LKQQIASDPADYRVLGHHYWLRDGETEEFYANVLIPDASRNIHVTTPERADVSDPARLHPKP